MLLKEDRCILKDKDEAIRLLTEKAAELGRIPKKQDFDSHVAGAIKQQLGPWPRALEKVGLKEVGKAYTQRKLRRQTKRNKRHGKQSSIKE